MSLDRRSFLQGALLGGAALATGASLAGTSKAARQPNQPDTSPPSGALRHAITPSPLSARDITRAPAAGA